MSTQNVDLIGILDSALDLAEHAASEQQEWYRKNADLQLKVAQSERLILEKVASVSIPATDVNRCMAKLASLGLVTKSEAVKLASEITNRPGRVLELLSQIAESATQSSSEGSGLDKSASEDAPSSEEDPDGWGAFARGDKVPARRY